MPYFAQHHTIILDSRVHKNGNDYSLVAMKTTLIGKSTTVFFASMTINNNNKLRRNEFSTPNAIQWRTRNFIFGEV